MQRSELTGTVLQLKALGIDNLLDFEWLAPPPSATVVRALEVLFSLGALDEDARLTRPLGVMLADLPLEPMLGKALLCSGCACGRAGGRVSEWVHERVHGWLVGCMHGSWVGG